jgi:hypothetical protein
MILYSLENRAFSCQEWANRAELYDFLESFGEKILLGEDSEFPDKYDSIKIYSNYATHVSTGDGGEESWAIGIISSQNSSAPGILHIPESKELLLGFSDKVLNISLSSKCVTNETSLQGLPFNSFFYVADLKIILVFYEIGVLAIEPNGKEIWIYEKDVITSSSFSEKNRLFLEFMDSESVTLDVKNGSIIGNLGT